jgi:hypothetical protein
MKLLLPLLLLTCLMSGQAPSVTAEWDVSQSAAALSTQAARLGPILEQLTPAEWVRKGAPQAYVEQWQSARQELQSLAESARLWGRQPDKLSAALDTFFRLQALETRLTSLAGGVRNYQNPAVGELLIAVMGENSGNREWLRQYITDLAAQKEQEFLVVDKEAQRCRSTLIRQPAAAPAKKSPGRP